MECPITYEKFEDSGENTPVMLPACGHTISNVAAAQLIANSKAEVTPAQLSNLWVAIRCPTCGQKQPKVRFPDPMGVRLTVSGDALCILV